LPVLLRALKARGYRIVHVVPAGPDRPKTVAPPEAWAARHTPLWPRVLERDQGSTERTTAEMIDLPITLAPVAAAGGPAAVAVSDIGVAWSVDHLIWPPAAKPAHVARRKVPIRSHRSAATRHRPRVEAPFPLGVKPPRIASHILTLH
jgi:hypothetical protein